MVSIHAPVKDATNHDKRRRQHKYCFNPRTRKGCDKDGMYITRADKVSIHAPVKDATPCLWKALLITFSAYNFANNKVYK